MVGKSFTSLSIGGFQFCKSTESLNFNSEMDTFEIDKKNIIGVHCNIVYSSPYSLLDDALVNCNSNMYSFHHNNLYHKHYFIDYSSLNMGEVRMNISGLLENNKMILENNTFYVKYKNYKSVRNIELDSVQIKVNNGSSLCIAYDDITDWTSDMVYNDKKVFAWDIEGNVYYNEDEVNKLTGVYKATIYYFEIIPYSDIFVNDGRVELNTLRIKRCIIKKTTKTNVNQFMIANFIGNNKNNYLVAVIT